MSKETLFENLSKLKHAHTYRICCIENHKDGTPHLHCVIKWTKKVDIRDEKYFDIQGYHPNIQTTKNINASINYIKKDGNYLEDGDIQEHVNSENSRALPEWNDVTYTLLLSLLVDYE